MILPAGSSWRLCGGDPAGLEDRLVCLTKTSDGKILKSTTMENPGAFLITKSGPKICKAFGISSYTLHSYLDESQSADESE